MIHYGKVHLPSGNQHGECTVDEKVYVYVIIKMYI